MYVCMYSGIPLPLNNIVWQRVQGRGQIGGVRETLLKTSCNISIFIFRTTAIFLGDLMNFWTCGLLRISPTIYNAYKI